MKNENVIDWSADYTLKVTDFKKETDDKESIIPSLEKRQCFSYINYGIDFDSEFSEDGKKVKITNIIVASQFNRKKSFFDLKRAQQAQISQKKIDFLILHEQGHFDLLEEDRERCEREISSRIKGRMFSIRNSEIDKKKENLTYMKNILLQCLIECGNDI